MSADNPDGIMVVIETDEYAGSFERELCAFITGRIGECEVGKECADDAKEALNTKVYDWFEMNVGGWCDDHGCYRPCTGIYNKNHKYNNVAISISKPPKYIRKVIEERAREYAARPKKHGKYTDYVEAFKILSIKYLDVKIRYETKEI